MVEDGDDKDASCCELRSKMRVDRDAQKEQVSAQDKKVVETNQGSNVVVNQNNQAPEHVEVVDESGASKETNPDETAARSSVI